MADTKITALTALTGADPANDVIPIVDVSDTTMAASGTTKKISVNNILGASGTATLASATITGALTVGNGTSATQTFSGVTNILDIGFGSLRGGSAYGDVRLWTDRFRIYNNAGTQIIKNISGTNGDETWYDGAGGTRMTLNSTGLGVGVSPSYKLDVLGSATISGRFKTSGALNALYLEDGGTTPGSLYIGTSGDTFRIITGSNVRMNVDVNGNVGIGVTPSAGKGCLQLSSGINFPATQVASSDANTLDDYEEGTFTPTIVGTTTAGTGTYSTQQGRYTKIGNQVTVHIYLDWSAHTGTGNLRLAGLPFQSSNNFHACSIGFWNNIAVTAANVPMAYVINQETNVALLQMPSGGGAMAGIPMDTAGGFVLTGTYTV